MILDREQFLSVIENLTADKTDDNTLANIADLTETYDNLSANGNDEELRTEYENKLKELDETWRKKYKDAFFHGAEETEETEMNEDDEEEKTSFEELFTEEKDGE